MYKYRVCLAAEYRAVARHKNVRVSYSLACLPTPDAPGQEDHEVGLKEYRKIVREGLVTHLPNLLHGLSGEFSLLKKILL